MPSSTLYGFFKNQITADLQIRRSDYVWLSIFTALLCVLTAGLWHPMPDSILYINQARNLIHGHGLTHADSTRWVASPGYPILISPFFLINDMPLRVLTLFQTLLTVIYMFGVFAWASRHTKQTAILITGAATLHAAVWQYCFPTTTEAAFMATMIWSIVCFTVWLDHRGTRLGKQAFTLAVLLICYCTFIRSAGLMIAVGAGIMLLLHDRSTHRSFRQTFGVLMIWLGLPGLVILGFLIHETQSTNLGWIQGTYLAGIAPNQSQGIFKTLLSGMQMRLSDIGRLMIPGMLKAYSRDQSWIHASMFIYLPIIAGLIWAWVKIIRHKSDPLLWSLLPFTALHIVYMQFADGARFMTPMLPVIMLLTWRLFGVFKSGQHATMLILLVLHASVIIGLTVREQPTLVDIHNQWKVAAICANLIKEDIGPVSSIEDVNSLGLQVAIIADIRVQRKRPLAEINQSKPYWILKRVTDKKLDHYEINWANNEFQLLKRKPPTQATLQNSPK